MTLITPGQARWHGSAVHWSHRCRSLLRRARTWPEWSAERAVIMEQARTAWEAAESVVSVVSSDRHGRQTVYTLRKEARP